MGDQRQTEIVMEASWVGGGSCGAAGLGIEQDLRLK